jgi:hypothetical protein
MSSNEPDRPALAFSPVLFSNADGVQEFRVITNGAKAEYGRSAGGQIDIVSRGGSNRWSGNLFEYLRNTALNANNFFNNSSGVDRPKFIQNTFGGSIGGPIRRDRLFVFANYQEVRTAQEVVRNRLVLTPEAKSGIFRWRAPVSGALQSFDIPRNDPRNKGIDPTVAGILALLPAPNNFDIGDVLNRAGFRFNSPAASELDAMMARADYNASPRWRLFYRYNWASGHITDTIGGQEPRFPGQLAGTQDPDPWGFSAAADFLSSAHTINELRVGYTTLLLTFNRPARLPGPMLLSSVWTDPLNPSFDSTRRTGPAEIIEQLTLVRGPHMLKAGIQLRFAPEYNRNRAGIYPDVSLARANNIPPANVGPAAPGAISQADRTSFEDLYNNLLGRISQVGQTFYSDLRSFKPAGTPSIHNYVSREYSGFLQDDWKLRRNLTLNIGLRYELASVPSERDGLQAAPDRPSQVDTAHHISDLAFVPGAPWRQRDNNNFAPRFGLAWDPGGDGKTAVRAVYGIFYDQLIGAVLRFVDSRTPGFAQTGLTFPNLTPGSDVRVSDGVPLPEQPGTPQLVLPNDRRTVISVFNPHLRTGYAQQFSFTIERELVRNTTMQAAFAGNRGIKLFSYYNPNQRRIYEDFLPAFRQIQSFLATGAPVPATNTLMRLYGSVNNAVSAIGASVFNDGSAGQAAGTVDQAYTRYLAAGLSDFYLRNFPQFNRVIVGTNDGRSYYNSLQIGVTRSSGALKLSANYTWSKSIDTTSNDGDSFDVPFDSFNYRLSRGLADSDRAHVFNSAVIYSVPIGKGRQFAHDWPRWLDIAAGGWELGGLMIWESGHPFTVYSGRQTAAVDLQTLANYDGDRRIGSVQRRGDGVYWFSPEEIKGFSFPAAGEIGASGRNAFRGPRYFDVDLSISKRFMLSERHWLAFRSEAYNVFNNANFALPGNNLTTPASLGRINSVISDTSGGLVGASSGGPRIVQLALRFEF